MSASVYGYDGGDGVFDENGSSVSELYTWGSVPRAHETVLPVPRHSQAIGPFLFPVCRWRNRGVKSFPFGCTAHERGEELGCEAPVISLLHPFHRSQTHASGMSVACNLVLCFALLSSLYLLPGASLLECLSKARAPSILASLYSYVFKTSLPFLFLAVYCHYSSSPGIPNLHWKSTVSFPCFPLLQFSSERVVSLSLRAGFDPRGADTVQGTCLFHSPFCRWI